jgi:hypothetical protein
VPTRGSDRQAVAPLAATAGEDRAACAGAHAETEAVGLVTAAVVRLERTLAHELVLSGSGVVRLPRTGGEVPFGWHRPPAGAPERALATARRPLTMVRGHAAPVETGSTAQRYAAPCGPVKPSVSHLRRAWDGTRTPCGQPLDPQVTRLLASAPVRHSPRPPSVPFPSSPPVGGPRWSCAAAWFDHSGRTAGRAPGAAGIRSAGMSHLADVGQHAQPVDKRVDQCSWSRATSVRSRACATEVEQG